MTIELLLKLNMLFYALFLIVFIFLITMGQRTSDEIEKRKMALENIKIKERRHGKTSDFAA